MKINDQALPLSIQTGPTHVCQTLMDRLQSSLDEPENNIEHVPDVVWFHDLPNEFTDKDI